MDRHIITQHTVAICAYNPEFEIFRRVIDAVKIAIHHATKDPTVEISLLLIDNNSAHPLEREYQEELSGLFAKVHLEKKQGLFFARKRAYEEAKTSFITFVDDDNVLEERSLQLIIENIRSSKSRMGILGGRVRGQFEVPPPDWIAESGIRLGCNDLGLETRVWSPGISSITKLSNTPPGSGVTMSRSMLKEYYRQTERITIRSRLGRQGKSLASGEDNDITIFGLRNGYYVKYDGRIGVIHLIPEERVSVKYLRRMAFASNRSWILLNAINWPEPSIKYFSNAVILASRGLWALFSAKGNPFCVVNGMRMLGAARGNLDVLLFFKEISGR